MISLILIVIGIACFVADAIRIEARVNWFSLGWAFVVGSVLVGQLLITVRFLVYWAGALGAQPVVWQRAVGWIH